MAEGSWTYLTPDGKEFVREIDEFLKEESFKETFELRFDATVNKAAEDADQVGARVEVFNQMCSGIRLGLSVNEMVESIGMEPNDLGKVRKPLSEERVERMKRQAISVDDGKDLVKRLVNLMKNRYGKSYDEAELVTEWYGRSRVLADMLTDAKEEDLWAPFDFSDRKKNG